MVAEPGRCNPATPRNPYTSTTTGCPCTRAYSRPHHLFIPLVWALLEVNRGALAIKRTDAAACLATPRQPPLPLEPGPLSYRETSAEINTARLPARTSESFAPERRLHRRFADTAAQDNR